jgi:hypothetical protein
VAHACNPSYSGGRDQEDPGLKPGQANSSRDPISKNPSQKKGWRSGLRWRPWVQTPVLPKQNKKNLKVNLCGITVVVFTSFVYSWISNNLFFLPQNTQVSPLAYKYKNDVINISCWLESLAKHEWEDMACSLFLLISGSKPLKHFITGWHCTRRWPKNICQLAGMPFFSSMLQL